MKKQLDKLKKTIKINKKMLVFLFGLSIVAIISGSTFATVLSDSDQQLVNTYITNFLNNIESDNLNYLDAFKNSFLSNILFIIIIWLLGISVIGIPIILFMYFVKGFIVGFTIANIIISYKLKGCLLSFFFIFPHHIVNLLLFIILLTYAYAFSARIIDAIFKRKAIDFKMIINKYLIILAICLFGIFITTLIEIFITPVFIKTILPFIK